MNDGALLKYYRKKGGLNQEEVSKGIVSTSYYSKIENGLIEPASETYDLLFKKLGIERSEIEKEKAVFKLLLKNWEEPLLYNQKKRSFFNKRKIRKYGRNYIRNRVTFRISSKKYSIFSYNGKS